MIRAPYAHLGDDIMKSFAATAPADANVADVDKATTSTDRTSRLNLNSLTSAQADTPHPDME